MAFSNEITFSSLNTNGPAPFPSYHVSFAEVMPAAPALPVFPASLKERVMALPREIRLHILLQFDEHVFADKIALWLAEDDPVTLIRYAREIDLVVSDDDDPRDVADLIRYLVLEGKTVDFLTVTPYVMHKVSTATFTRDFCDRPHARWNWWRFRLASSRYLQCPCRGRCSVTFKAMIHLGIDIRVDDDLVMWNDVLKMTRFLPYRPYDALNHLAQFPKHVVQRVYHAILKDAVFKRDDDPEWAKFKHSDEFFTSAAEFTPDEETKDEYRIDLIQFLCRGGGWSPTSQDDPFVLISRRMIDFQEKLEWDIRRKTTPFEPPRFPVFPGFPGRPVPHTKFTVIWLASHLSDLEWQDRIRFWSASFPADLREKICALPDGEEKSDLLWRHCFFFGSGRWTWEDYFSDIPKTMRNSLKKYFTVSPLDNVEFPLCCPGIGLWCDSWRWHVKKGFFTKQAQEALLSRE